MPSTISSPKMQAAFRSVRGVLAVIGIGALAAACSATAFDGPRDVGNMAYPEPLRAGNLTTTWVGGGGSRDVGNMAYPQSLPQGNLGTISVVGRGPRDTGNMAYPTPLSAGNGPVALLK